MEAGGSFSASIEVLPANARYDGVVFFSSDVSVVSVDDSGLVTCIKPGEAFITAWIKNSSAKDTVKVTVSAPKPEKILIKPDSADISVGDTVKFFAEVFPETSGGKFLWKSSDESVAYADESGIVTGRSPGLAAIEVFMEDMADVKASVYVKVSAAPENIIRVTGITLEQSSIGMERLEKRVVSASVLPGNADNKRVTFVSDNEEVVEITSFNELLAKKIGSANITAITEDGGFTATCAVTVTGIPVREIAVEPENISLLVGESYVLSPSILPENADDRLLEYSSSDSSVAEVSIDGLVTARGAGGAYITVSSGNGVKNYVNVSASYDSGIVISRTSINIASNGDAEEYFTVVRNSAYTVYNIKNDLPDWIKLEKHTEGLSDFYRVFIKDNKLIWSRSAGISFTDAEGKNSIGKVSVYQIGNQSPSKRVVWVKGVKTPSEGELIREGDAPFYYWPEKGDGGWYNVVKRAYATHTYNDSQMCWAMAASSMLHWWMSLNEKYVNKYKEINPGSYDAEKCLAQYDISAGEDNKSSIGNLFRKTFPNKGGDPLGAVNWFILGRDYGSYRGLGCFSDVFTLDDKVGEQFYIWSKEDFEYHIKDALENGKAIGLTYTDESTLAQHVVAVWGVVFDEFDNVIEIYNADSNVPDPHLFNFGVYYPGGNWSGEPYYTNISANSYTRNKIDRIIKLRPGEDVFGKYFQEKGVSLD